jgi:hypothetical protein
MGLWRYIAIAALSFSAGMYAENSGMFAQPQKMQAAQDSFYQKPYSLKISVIERNSRLETYLVDTATKEYRKIDEGMSTNECPGKKEGMNLETKIGLVSGLYRMLGLLY